MRNGQKAASENFSSCDALTVTDQNVKSESDMIKKNRSVNFADFWFSSERHILAPSTQRLELQKTKLRIVFLFDNFEWNIPFN